MVPARPDGIMLPKATRANADQLDHYLTALEAAAGIPIGGIATLVLATETAQAMFGLGDYAGTPRLAALSWGRRGQRDRARRDAQSRCERRL